MIKPFEFFRCLAQTSTIFILMATPAASAPLLKPAFDIAAVKALIGRPQHLPICKKVEDPVTDMAGFKSAYDPKDPTQSKVDAARAASEKARSAAFDAFAKSLDRLADRALLATPENPEISQCLFSHLAAWARSGAMLQNVEENDDMGQRHAVMMQAWYGAGFANAALKAGGLDAARPEDRQAVRDWFAALSRSIMAEFAPSTFSLKRHNNHDYWAAYAVSVMGVLLQDRQVFEFGRPILSEALLSTDEDGALPSEMWRGERAYMYQQFATLPIVGQVVLYAANGVELTADEKNALYRILSFNAAAVGNPLMVEKYSKVKPVISANNFDFAWIDMSASYLARENPDLAKKLETVASAKGMRPAWHIYLGGSVTEAYNPQASLRK